MALLQFIYTREWARPHIATLSHNTALFKITSCCVTSFNCTFSIFIHCCSWIICSSSYTLQSSVKESLCQMEVKAFLTSKKQEYIWIAKMGENTVGCATLWKEAHLPHDGWGGNAILWFWLEYCTAPFPSHMWDREICCFGDQIENVLCCFTKC